MITINGEPWGTSAEIAEAMGISLRTVRRYVASGSVACSGRHRRLSDVVAEEKASRDRMRAGKPSQG